MKQNILVSAGVALLVVVLGLVIFGRPVERIINKFGAFPGNEWLTDTFCLGGQCTKQIVGSCSNVGTTTGVLFSIQNPFRATSTWISLGTYIDVTGAATSGPIGITVATSTDQGVSTSSTANATLDDPGWGLIYQVGIPTNSLGYISAGGVFATTTAQFVGSAPGGPNYSRGPALSPGTTTQQIVLGPSDYVLGYATGTGVNSVGNPSSTFTCKYGLRFIR